MFASHSSQTAQPLLAGSHRAAPLIRASRGLTQRCHSACRSAVKAFAAASTAQQKGSERVSKERRPAHTVPNEKTVLLQGFGWSSCEVGGWYNVVQENIPKLKEAGFTHIWLPPPSQSVAPQGYLPGRLYDLSTPYGNKEELVSLLAALRKAGIKSVADIVINHRCADKQDKNGVWNKFSDDIDHKGEPVDWGRWAITCDDPDFRGKGSRDTGEDYHAAPDLDHTNEGLRKSLVDWLNWLKTDIGFDAWRFDFVKGYGPEFMNDYVGQTVGQQEFNVGEYWVDLSWGEGLDFNQNGPRQALCDWLDKAGGACLFDFVSKGILNEAVKNTEYWRLRDEAGKNPGLMGWWPSRAVTFIDNHDTDDQIPRTLVPEHLAGTIVAQGWPYWIRALAGSTQQHWPFPGQKEETGYAYILTHPGIPSVLWEHHFDYGLKDAINKLISIRNRNGITSRSGLEIVVADHDLYFARIDGKVAVKLGPRHEIGDLAPSEHEGWKLAASGPDYAVWEKNQAAETANAP